MKYYEFKYPSETAARFEKSALAFINIILPFIVAVIVDYYLHKTPIVNLEWYSIAEKVLYILCIIASYLLFKTFVNNPKGVFVYDNYISIDRQTISKWHMSKMNFTIDIHDIEYCKMEKRSMSNYSDRYYHMLGGIGNPFIIIKTKTQTYCFCIENQEDFLNEVYKRMDNEQHSVSDD